MSLNIKNEETHQFAKELVELTGSPRTGNDFALKRIGFTILDSNF